MAPSRTCTRPSEIRSRSVGILSVVVQVGSQPALHCCDVERFSPGIILHLVPLDLAHPEVLPLRPPEVVPADRSRREHGVALRQGDAGVLLGREQVEEGALFSMIGAGGIARRRWNSLIPFLDQPLFVQRPPPGVAPELGAPPPMQLL